MGEISELMVTNRASLEILDTTPIHDATPQFKSHSEEATLESQLAMIMHEMVDGVFHPSGVKRSWDDLNGIEKIRLEVCSRTAINFFKNRHQMHVGQVTYSNCRYWVKKSDDLPLLGPFKSRAEASAAMEVTHG